VRVGHAAHHGEAEPGARARRGRTG
jgi:hypothetical protein